jgi:thiol-disulfide isomerase/thioredoxin
MSTHTIIGLLVALVVIGGGAYLLLPNPEADSMMKDDAKADEAMMGSSTDSMMQDESGVGMMKAGSYEVYAPEKLARADAGDVVLFFRATWCPTCKAVDEDIRAHLSAIPSGLTILDVDYDNSTALKKQYGVTYQHTFVQVNADGTLIKKWSGSTTLAALLAEVQ